MIWLSSLASVGVVSAISLVGLWLLTTERARMHRLVRLLVSLAVGTLLGDSFIHLLPEAFARTPINTLGSSLLVLAGMLLFFMVGKLSRHHRQGPPQPQPAGGSTTARPELVMVNLIGDSIHNFMDGALIAASYLSSPTLGVSTTLAVICHELPQELGDLGVLLHAGLGVRRAVALNLASAGTAVAGAVTTLLAGEAAGRQVSDVLVPLAAGGFVYLAAAELMPELQRDRSSRALAAQLLWMMVGIGLMAALALLE